MSTAGGAAAGVLVVEDDGELRRVLVENLRDEGYDAHGVTTGAEARRALASASPGEGVDLIILDIMLPDTDGYTLCRRLRAERVDAMILMLTARTLEDDLVRGLAEGADDYLTKPYRLRELLARIEALLRRRSRGPADELAFGPYVLDVRARRVVDGAGREVPLTRTELDLLHLLLSRAGTVLSRNEILDHVWGRVVVEPRTVDNFISSLKRKLPGDGAAPPFRIVAVRGIGYRLET